MNTKTFDPLSGPWLIAAGDRLPTFPGGLSSHSFTAIWDVQYISIEDGDYVYHGFYR